MVMLSFGVEIDQSPVMQHFSVPLACIWRNKTWHLLCSSHSLDQTPILLLVHDLQAYMW